MKKLTLLMIAFAMTLTMSFQANARDSQTNKTTEVKSYTKKDGTVVKGYTRTKKTDAAPETTEVKGYTKKDGTVVKGYSRKKATKSN